ncbi:hypothetical protein T484DRAFT_2253006 [Baffinella frigidus]|nr:hypothetical protein T484DRAFT_2253006 [Cryptophyta sp. CCMP2293]
MVLDSFDEALNLRWAQTTKQAEAGGLNLDQHLVEAAKAKEFNISGIFSLLHQQPYDTQLKIRVASGMIDELIIPDTVTFRAGVSGFPCWYLSSKQDPGMIKRKNQSNVTAHKILEAFSKKTPVAKGARSTQGHGIIAVLVTLRDFLDTRSRTFSGILQKWVDPKGQHNSMLHAAWTSKMCKVTCLTNVRSLTDRRASTYDRAVTFDGSDSHATRDPVSQQTQELVQVQQNNPLNPP